MDERIPIALHGDVATLHYLQSLADVRAGVGVSCGDKLLSELVQGEGDGHSQTVVLRVMLGLALGQFVDGHLPQRALN